HSGNVAVLAAPAGRGLFSKFSNRCKRVRKILRRALIASAARRPLGRTPALPTVLLLILPFAFVLAPLASPMTSSLASARDRAAPLASSGDSPAAPFTLAPWRGGELPAFTLDDLTGEARHTATFKGRTVLVHFFATWCEPCVPELASLQRLAHASRDEPLAIVAIDVGEVDLRVRAFFEKRPVDFPVLLDRDRSVAKAWSVTSLPTTFVLDATLQPRLFVEG